MHRATALDFAFRHRSAIPLLLAAPVVITATRQLPGGLPLLLPGLLLVAAGVWLRLLSIRRIGRGARVHRAHASAGLITDGPYRFSRNPLYLAAAVILCGLGLLAGLGPWSALLLLATPLAYSPVVLAEERALGALLGEPFEAYVHSVPRWLGRPRRREESGDPVLVPWSEVFRRERWLVPGSALAALGVIGLRTGWLPLDRLFEPVARTLGCSPAALMTAGFGIALLANAVSVELHQRRRRDRRAATS